MTFGTFTDLLPALEDASRRALMVRLGVTERCPACGAKLSHRVLIGWYAGKRVRCRPCGFHGTWRAGTALAGGQIASTSILLVDFAELVGADRRLVAAALGLSPATVGKIAAKLAGNPAEQSGGAIEAGQ